MKSEVFENLFWEAVKPKVEKRTDISYLNLGGNSLGIFLFTEGIKKELGIVISPEVLLADDATLENLKTRYLKV
jgi:acyl carrier protein